MVEIIKDLTEFSLTIFLSSLKIFVKSLIKSLIKIIPTTKTASANIKLAI